MPTERARPSLYLLPPERYLPASALSTWLGRIVNPIPSQTQILCRMIQSPS
ncbi:hypothetical protein FOXYSP1_04936 [Fusarium oxysporum f. sp. phaseoli]